MFVSFDADRPFDHVAVAVTSLEEGCRLYELLSGVTRSKPEVLEAQGVRVAFVGSVELLEPLGSETPVGRFLQRHGPGLHHVAYRTDDIVSELARLEAEGLELRGDVCRGAVGACAADLSTLEAIIRKIPDVRHGAVIDIRCRCGAGFLARGGYGHRQEEGREYRRDSSS